MIFSLLLRQLARSRAATNFENHSRVPTRGRQIIVYPYVRYSAHHHRAGREMSQSDSPPSSQKIEVIQNQAAKVEIIEVIKCEGVKVEIVEVPKLDVSKR